MLIRLEVSAFDLERLRNLLREVQKERVEDMPPRPSRVADEWIRRCGEALAANAPVVAPSESTPSAIFGHLLGHKEER